ncbi:hypothetical protein J8281_16930 [Aquimarina sp. U1-2]|uniref:Ig-like domain-containing protein n=1 Tax=Aquimarina sp. U1-2 TaxID=2823141 RepID=UPI001AECC2FF|nr:Ig-like domain-containing protein [Aquimarina sp. U1-2]MBP2833883.1 hypothetical protein [Aquimarina sp. U1-2]
MKSNLFFSFIIFSLLLIIIQGCSEDEDTTPSITANPEVYETEMFVTSWFDNRKNIQGNVLDNDSEQEGVSITIIEDVSNGSLTIDLLTGAFTYSPNVDFAGIDKFTYQVCTLEGVKVCDIAEVTLNILQIDIRIDNEKYTGTKSNNIEGNVLRNDIVNVDVLVEVVTDVGDGTLTLDSNTGDFIYTPNPGFTGRDTFVYQVCDINNQQSCFTGEATFSIFDNDFDAVIVSDGHHALPGESIIMDITANDDLPDFYEIEIVSAGNFDVFKVNDDNTITYTPKPEDENYTGTVSFTYSVDPPVSNIINDVELLFIYLSRKKV